MPSQLKQLKQTVNNAGIKKNKRKFEGNSQDKDKRKKISEEIHTKFNPFDTQVQRLKHNVGGRKVIGSIGAPAKAKQAGINQRKEALLPALENRNKSSKFKDRRFGEQDPTLDEEERMLERYQAEKANSGKRSRNNADFNLEDNDELTHYGQSLALDDDFANAGLGDNDDDDAGTRFDAFGGFNDDEEEEPIDYDHPDAPPRRKTKAEVMEELITKSKQHKMERQQQREDDDALREEVDADLDEIKGMLFDAPALDVKKEDEKAQAKKSDDNSNYKGDKSGNENYDQFVRQLAFDKRAKPTDRLKTEAEVAFDAKEELERKERARVLRMRGEDDQQVINPSGGYAARRQRAREEEEAEKEEDDDEDDEQMEDAETYGIGKGLDGGDSEEGDEDEEEDEEEEDDDDDDDDGDDDDDDEESIAESNEGELGDVAETDSAPIKNLVDSNKKKSKKLSGKATASDSSSLPYTFACPTNHDDFMDIIESYNVEQSEVPVVIERIRTIYHPELGEDNKAKLSLFNGVLIDHLIYTASSSANMELMGILSKNIVQLTNLLPIPSAETFKEKLQLLQRNFNKGLSSGSTSEKSKTWPGIPELSLLRLIGVVWSTSDFSHPVASAAQLLIGQYLSQARIRNGSDIIKGLVLCGISLQYENYSKRFIPEVVNFLVNSVLILGGVSKKAVPGQHPVPDVGRLPQLALTKNDKEQPRASIPLKDSLDESSSNSLQSRVDILDKTLSISREAAQMWGSLDGFIEAFQPLVEGLDVVSKKDVCGGKLKSHLEKTSQQIRNQVKFAKQARRPLRMQQHKQIAISSLIPKFEENYNADKRYDPDRERAASSKLKAEVKAERKGALRELRKDAKFIAAHKQQKRIEELGKYEDTMRKKVDRIGDERYEEKTHQKAKAKAKKMAGK
ncbi:Nop14-like protein [Wallemia mellicola]|nr:Nop14-like protein [Wallemia mellicola]